MADVHLLLDWHMGLLGCATTDATPSAVPLSMDWKITCPQCLACLKRTMAGPQKIKKAKLSQPPQGEAVLTTGLDPLVGALGKPMHKAEMALYAVLKADGTILRIWYEPCALLLPGGVKYYPDFRVVLWDGSLVWYECKPRKKTTDGSVKPYFHDAEARMKWKQAIDLYTKDDERFRLAIYWRERGVYRWDVQEGR